ncbi:hypothetical protein EIK77_009171 [Talaromyces pinophilus]|nr:hypothetical protein EIK77_009171 [Talaromyces pinophilus]
MSLTESSASEIAQSASIASRRLATISNDGRNFALTTLHAALVEKRDYILQANAKDVALATQAAANGELSQSVLKRLDLTRPGKYDDMLSGILIGRVTMRTLLDDGLVLERVTCPLGTLLIIFEARPEVIANIAALAIKSGNAAILKGGKESTESFIAIAQVISAALSKTEIPIPAIQLVKTRDIVSSLLSQDTLIDLVIPRGSNELVRYVKDNTKIPVLGHADGLCSAYIHSDADVSAAVRVIVDSKTDYPAACNALETLLVHEDVLESILPAVAEALLAKGVSLRCDQASKAALTKSLAPAQAALIQDSVEQDYNTEFLDLILAIKTVPSQSSDSSAVQAAVAHINAHGSKHTDIVLTTSRQVADTFMAGIDSAGVYWNASSRFADGMRYGFGTEVGISTNKIHTRGPVGLEGLTIYKYLIRGEGHIAAEYGGAGDKRVKHQKLEI